MDGRTDGRTDGPKDGRAGEQTDGWVDGRTDGRMYERTDDGRTNGRMGGRTDDRSMWSVPVRTKINRSIISNEACTIIVVYYNYMLFLCCNLCVKLLFFHADIYVKVSLVRHRTVVKTKHTDVVKRDDQPNFNESFVFKLPVDSLDTTSIVNAVWQSLCGKKGLTITSNSKQATEADLRSHCCFFVCSLDAARSVSLHPSSPINCNARRLTANGL